MKVSCLALVGLCIATMCSGCGAPLTSPVSGRVGQKCLVQFRRDALGAAVALPIDPRTEEMNGTIVNLVGTLEKAQADSVLLSNDLGECLIPMGAILYVRFPDAKK